MKTVSVDQAIETGGTAHAAEDVSEFELFKGAACIKEYSPRETQEGDVVSCHVLIRLLPGEHELPTMIADTLLDAGLAELV